MRDNLKKARKQTGMTQQEVSTNKNNKTEKINFHHSEVEQHTDEEVFVSAHNLLDIPPPVFVEGEVLWRRRDYMTISEATKEAIKINGYIARNSWGERYTIYIQPTNSPMCCLLLSILDIRPSPRWEPSANDLMAEDWYVLQ